MGFAGDVCNDRDVYPGRRGGRERERERERESEREREGGVGDKKWSCPITACRKNIIIHVVYPSILLGCFWLQFWVGGNASTLKTVVAAAAVVAAAVLSTDLSPTAALPSPRRYRFRCSNSLEMTNFGSPSRSSAPPPHLPLRAIPSPLPHSLLRIATIFFVIFFFSVIDLHQSHSLDHSFIICVLASL